jgi:hypothetical protein
MGQVSLPIISSSIRLSITIIAIISIITILISRPITRQLIILSSIPPTQQHLLLNTPLP